MRGGGGQTKPGFVDMFPAIFILSPKTVISCKGYLPSGMGRNTSRHEPKWTLQRYGLSQDDGIR